MQISDLEKNIKDAVFKGDVVIIKPEQYDRFSEHFHDRREFIFDGKKVRAQCFWFDANESQEKRGFTTGDYVMFAAADNPDCDAFWTILKFMPNSEIIRLKDEDTGKKHEVGFVLVAG